MMELCSGDNCLDNDTLIVLCYAVFCVCFGFIVALLVILADKSRSSKKTDNSPSNNAQNVEVEQYIIPTFIYLNLPRRLFHI